MSLSLDDSVKIGGIERLRARVPLNLEQIGYFENVCKQIERINGKTIKVKKIENIFSLVGERKDKDSFRYFKNHFNAELLSLRFVGPTKVESQALEDFKKGIVWGPIIKNERFYLIADENTSTLYFGIVRCGRVNSRVDGMGYCMGKIKYKKVG